MWELQQILAEVAGLPAVTLQPAAGSQGELTGLMLMRAYFADRGEGEQRDTIITADTAHGTNPASVTMAGYKLEKVATTDRGNLDLDDLRAKVNERTAGLMLTNPSTLGLFDEDIVEVAEIFHDAGALALLRRRQPQRGRRQVAARRHGLRHRPLQPPQDVLAAARRRRAGRRAGGGARRPGAVPALAAGRARRRRLPARPRPARSRSAACAASPARSASSCARTPSCAPTAPTCRRCPRRPCSTRTTCSPGCATTTRLPTIASACTSSCSRLAR